MAALEALQKTEAISIRRSRVIVTRRMKAGAGEFPGKYTNGDSSYGEDPYQADSRRPQRRMATWHQKKNR